MRPFLLRLASLTCGLLLALPPGWCCLWLPGPARAVAASTDAPAEPCCPCCCHPAQPTELPPPAPAPVPRCPCADRDATTPEAVKPPALQAGADPGAPVPAAADLSPSAAPGGSLPALSLALSSAPLNVLHCVWLC
jgi:hypothetical protein